MLKLFTQSIYQINLCGEGQGREQILKKTNKGEGSKSKSESFNTRSKSMESVFI